MIKLYSIKCVNGKTQSWAYLCVFIEKWKSKIGLNLTWELQSMTRALRMADTRPQMSKDCNKKIIKYY